MFQSKTCIGARSSTRHILIIACCSCTAFHWGTILQMWTARCRRAPWHSGFVAASRLGSPCTTKLYHSAINAWPSPSRACIAGHTLQPRTQRYQAQIASKRPNTISMAFSSRLTWLLAAAAMATAFLPAPASAEDFLVGGTTGWNLSYPIGWPEGKPFKVGDNLGTKTTLLIRFRLPV